MDGETVCVGRNHGGDEDEDKTCRVAGVDVWLAFQILKWEAPEAPERSDYYISVIRRFLKA
jgi:hypothetical protein